MGLPDRRMLLPFNLRQPFCADPRNALTFCEEERAQLHKLRELQLARHIDVKLSYAGVSGLPVFLWWWSSWNAQPCVRACVDVRGADDRG